MRVDEMTKSQLRESVKHKRLSMDCNLHDELNHKICRKVTELDEYKNAKAVLIYVSSEIEVSTAELINKCFSDGKRVYAPRCIIGTNDMDFHEINSFEDLEKRYMGIFEPKEKCEKLVDFADSICIVPALAYDVLGYRLGFGKGFYDKYLSKYTGAKVGICYDYCVFDRLCSYEFDIPVDILITDKRMLGKGLINNNE